MVSEAGTGKCSNHPTSQPSFSLHPYGSKFYMNLYPYGFAAAIGTWASISLSISAGEFDDNLPWPISKTIQIKVLNQLNLLNAWNQTIESKELTRPNSADFSTVPTVRYPYVFPHTKHYFSMKLMVTSIVTLCISRFHFLTPQYYLPSHFFFSFSVEAPNQFQNLVCGVSCRVSHNAKQC